MGLSTELMTSMMARLRRRAVSSAITSLTTVAFRAAMTAFLATPHGFEDRTSWGAWSSILADSGFLRA
jgi:hypothetical protein